MAREKRLGSSSPYPLRPRRGGTAVQRVGYIFVTAVVGLALGDLVLQMAEHSTRQGAMYRALVLLIPLAVLGVAGALVAAIGPGSSRRPAGAPKSAVRRVVLGVTALVIALIVAGVLIDVAGLAPGHPVLSAVLDAAALVVSPFRFVFLLGQNRIQVALNWGIGAAVYLGLGFALARLLDALLVGGAREGRTGRSGHRGA